jgi:hypothetical protein
MVPRMRTGGGCCAHATDASIDDASTDNVSAAASARGVNEEIPGMVFPFLGFGWQRGKHLSAGAIPPASAAFTSAASARRGRH